MKSMQTSSLLANFNEEAVRKAISDYEFTCQTIVAMSNIVSYNLGGTTTPGKELRTSSANAISPNITVTPDIVIEVQAKRDSESYHAVDEIKISLSKDQTYWMKVVEQLKKYDDELTGWDVPNSNPHDIMFTTNELRVFAFQKFLSDLSSTGRVTFSRKLSLFHSTPMEQKDSFILIKKDHGIISNQKLDDLLANGQGVPKLKIVREIDQMKFYDSNPPFVYTMMIIWDHVLKTYLSQSQLRDLKGNKLIPIAVTVEQIREKLSIFAPDPNNSCVRKDWVRDALTAFVELGVAEFVDREGEKFEIKFKTHRSTNWIFDSIKAVSVATEREPSDTLDKYTKGNN